MSDVPIHVARATGLVGRERQLADLREAYATARGGEPVTVLVGGEAGIGKTRLTEEFVAEVVADGARAVIGQSVPLDGEGPAFAPLVGALRGLYAEFGAERLLELAGPGADALAGLVPELGVAPVEGPEGRGRLYEVVSSLLERVAAERPLVVLLEDLQWADSPTRDLLRFMVRGVRESRLLLVVTYRTDELHRGHPLRPLLAELDRLRQVHRIELPRLDADEVVLQLRGLLGRPPEHAHVQRIVQRSEGIPFFVEELAWVDVDGGCSELPGSLRDLLLVRVEPLTEDTQRLLRLMSAAGNRVDHSVLELVAEEQSGALEAALREAVSAGVIVVDGDGYAFRHALLREALHDDMLPGEHARMHARYAQALEAHPELMPHGPTAAEVAHHWYSAHDVERAFAWSLTAADELVRSYAHATAQQLLERALELWDQVAEPEKVAGSDRPHVLIRAATEAYAAGEFERTLSLVKEALRLVDRTADPARAGWLLAQLGSVTNRLGRPGAIEALMEARELIPAEPSVQRAEALDWLATMLMLDWRFEECLEVADEAERVAAAIGLDRIVASAHVTRGTAWVHMGDAERALAELRLAGITATSEPDHLHRYFVNLSDAYTLLGRYRDAVDVATEGYELARQRGRKRTSGVVLAGNAAEPMLALGDWERAERMIERGLELVPPPNHERHMIGLKAWLGLWRGEVEAAATAVERLRAGMTRRAVLPQDSRLVARLEADVALAQGDAERAWGAVFAEVGSRIDAAVPGYDLPLAFAGAQALGARIRAAGGTQGLEADVEWLRALTDHAARGWPVDLWSLLVDAELSGLGGTDAAAWQRALVALEAAEGPVHLVSYAGYRLGRALIEAGDRDGALEALRAAAASADAVGAGLFRAWVDDLSRRAHLPLVSGVPSPRVAPSGLTVREHEVLRLVAQGRSNREIGETLFISSKTASVHVSNILAKLGASGRGEAAAIAHRDGLLDTAAS
ncbi:helix-turn-helix transcriptional regulator [Jiangella mangrovi]|uniref:DNA-binding CsgD family transcriptional regulator/tetratricopeptide (TPR) repeat protein n=1 Tax=Jiangella mangrovi TaxID=1524084 RepID=A0A7W9GL46_9ACTN|nr:AAA family ATPase [Jiangella mangrovi]MBB5785662.1 DNA-binding CsgD family transcriptional regulator/tetratricopeptide (TPR) repeat protein [Jiangella mangrovi]